MNTRIQELAEQATEDCLGVRVLNQQHFAELIVRECIDIVSAGISNATDWDSSYWDQACENRTQAIKQHFGIQE